MEKTIKEIWIESENKGPVTCGQLYSDDNSDVIVTMTDGKKYVATFFTYDNVKTLTEKIKRQENY
jgi:pyruvate/2-oxoacid:ferredoxin oxidoreductase beta subunit